MPASQIQAVLFDLDGTLCHGSPSWSQTFDGLAVVLTGIGDGLESTLRAKRWDHYYWAQSPDLQTDLTEFSADQPGFWVNYMRRRLVVLGCSDQQARTCAPAMYQRLADFKPMNVVPSDVPGTLQALRLAGKTLGLVTNRRDPLGDLLDGLGLGGYFHFALTSGEAGSWKPDPAIFQHALQLAKTLPGQTVYVGDNYFADVVGARRAGLQPVLVDPQGIFYAPGCPVISCMAELPARLGFS